MKPAPSPSLWLANRRYDAGFFFWPAVFFLTWLIPYAVFGARAVFPLYVASLILFALPHNYLTWVCVAPASPRKSLRMGFIHLSCLAALSLCALLPFTREMPANDWILTAIAVLAIWHIYRQHHGICKIYDAVQARRTGDATIFADRKAMNVFLALALWGTLLWAFTHANLEFHLSQEEHYRLVHPLIPRELFYAYVALTVAAGVWAIKRAILDRARAGRFVPWPQLVTCGAAVGTFVIPYLFLPVEAMPLSVAIATSFHNVQYFGFVWIFERHRSRELAETGQALQYPQRWALQGFWKRYFAMALVFSWAAITLSTLLPQQAGRVMLYFLAVSHYLMDGFIWRRDCNSALTPALARLAAAQASVPAPAPVSG